LLVKYIGKILPENIIVSTRQPSLLKDFSTKFGVKILFDNAYVAMNCDLIFLCCLPYQLDTVVKDFKKPLHGKMLNSKKSSIIVSILAGITAQRIASTIDGKIPTDQYDAIITTKINSKKLKSALSRQGEDNVGKQKIYDSLSKMYKKMSKQFSGPKIESNTARSEKPADTQSDFYTEDEQNMDENEIIVRNFVISEAAAGLAQKRGDEIISWVKVFCNAFPEVGYKRVTEIILGENYVKIDKEKLQEYFYKIY